MRNHGPFQIAENTSIAQIRANEVSYEQSFLATFRFGEILL